MRILTAMVLSTVVLVSCEKEGPARFKGNWTFKTGGSVTLQVIPEVEEPETDPQQPGENTDPEVQPGENQQPGEKQPVIPDGEGNSETPETPVEPETRTAEVGQEWGQMDIVVKDKKEGILLVSMNAVLGDAIAFEAVADGKNLEIKPFQKKITLDFDPVGKTTTYVTVTGQGERYENTVLFHFQFEGEISRLGKNYEFKETRVDCIARLNQD